MAYVLEGYPHGSLATGRFFSQNDQNASHSNISTKVGPLLAFKCCCGSGLERNRVQNVAVAHVSEVSMQKRPCFITFSCLRGSQTLRFKWISLISTEKRRRRKKSEKLYTIRYLLRKYEKARIAKAGNFEVPVSITSEHENIAWVRNGLNGTYIVVSSVDQR